MISRDAFRNISLVTVVAVFAAAALVGFGVYRYAVLKGDLERHEALVAVAEDRIENLEEELGSEYGKRPAPRGVEFRESENGGVSAPD